MRSFCSRFCLAVSEADGAESDELTPASVSSAVVVSLSFGWDFDLGAVLLMKSSQIGGSTQISFQHTAIAHSRISVHAPADLNSLPKNAPANVFRKSL